MSASTLEDVPIPGLFCVSILIASLLSAVATAAGKAIGLAWERRRDMALRP